MTVAIALLISAAMAGWLAPQRLGRADLRRRDPLVLIVDWLLSMAGVIFAAVAGVVLLLIPSHLAGRPGVVVATEGLTKHLAAEGVAAVPARSASNTTLPRPPCRASSTK